MQSQYTESLRGGVNICEAKESELNVVYDSKESLIKLSVVSTTQFE